MKRWVNEAFYSGNYQKIIDQADESDPEQLSYIISSLAAVGRHLEAENLYAKNSTRLSKRLLPLFSLLLASIRKGAEEKIIERFLALFTESKQKPGPNSRSFLYQSLGLIRFYRGDYPEAIQYAEKALQASLTVNQRYLCLLSYDLMGHCHCMFGRIPQGLIFFRSALEISKQFKNQQNSDLISLSIMTYEIEAGLEIEKNQGRLEAWMKTIRPQDTYSKNNAHLAQAKVLMLKGQFKQAGEKLFSMARDIYQFDHHTQILRYNFLLASLRMITHGKELAQDLIQTSLRLCHSKKDLHHRQAFEKLLESKSIPRFRVELKSAIEKGLYGSYHLNFLVHFQNTILFQLIKNKILVFYDLQVFILDGLSSWQSFVLDQLCKSPVWTKEEFYRAIWGGEYLPHLHENKIYVTLGRLKKKLGPLADCLVIQDSFIRFEDFAIEKKRIEKVDHLPVLGNPELNFRQEQILQIMSQGEVIAPKKYCEIFQVSRNTASRDLTELAAKGHLIQRGLGRGRIYTKQPTLSHTN